MSLKMGVWVKDYHLLLSADYAIQFQAGGPWLSSPCDHSEFESLPPNVFPKDQVTGLRKKQKHIPFCWSSTLR